MPVVSLPEPCPCGSGTAYDACCGPLHVGARQAETPEEVMRSRYSAYVLGRTDHVFRTWHPRTRPDTVSPRPELTWTGLEVHRAEDDVVEFTAHFRTADGPGVHHEVSLFERRGGRWVYVEAVSR